MPRFTKTHQAHLHGYGDRVTFDPIERMLYGHDVGAIPALVQPLIGKGMPDAVVQPRSEDEVIALLKWAEEQGLPVTPRGKATSGYGGAIPVRKGLVIDFRRLNRVVSVDEGSATAIVESGTTWERLDNELARHGLTPRQYPTSYPSSTVGGWFAQGGAGIGSYAFGAIRESVEMVRVVLPSGEVRELTGSDLDLAYGAEGTTGLITRLRLKLRTREDEGVIAYGCPSPRELQAFFVALAEGNLPLWNVMYINPRMAEFRNITPLREHNGHPAENRVNLPSAFVVSLTFARKDYAAVDAGVKTIAASSGLTRLSDEIATHLWEHRFKIMQVKRLGPSLVPTEVIVPLHSLESFSQELGQKVTQPFIKEGLLVRKGRDGKPEVVILGFIPADERTFGYNLVFSLSLSVSSIAERHGGRVYASGLYFAGKAKLVHGDGILDRMTLFRRSVDPRNILNPGKIYANGLLGVAMAVAQFFEWIARPLANRVATKVGERPAGDKNRIPADVGWYAYGCSQCGYCVDTCDQFYGRGWESQSPRGKWYLIRQLAAGRLAWSQKLVDTFLVCTTCERCNLRCSAALPIENSWMKLRGRLIHEDKRMTFPPFEMMNAALSAEGNIWAGYRRDRSAWFPKDLFEKHGPDKKSKAVYFAGCTASYVEQDIGMGSVRLLDAAGVDFSYLGNKENCCGTPMLVAGKWDTFADVMKRNIAAVKAAGAETVITSCPACDMMWRHAYPAWARKLGIDYGITARHYSEMVAEKLRNGTFTFPANSLPTTTVTWHDSCHIGRVSGVYREPREVIKAIPNVKFVEMASNCEEGKCCGSVLTLIKEPAVAAEIGKERLDEAVDVGAEKVLALCPCCQFQLRVSADKKNIPVDIVDLSRFAANALGFDLPDPNPEVRRQWAVFEAMIALMTPRGFADLMGTMWPEMIGAMPLGMGPMMRVMGRIPGALDLMKPMFPVLFPILLPMMMPKVMPTMLSRVRDRVPMPDYMAEQMPDLMPKVMNNLMPHMVKDVVPLVVQPMIDHLRGRAGRAA